VRQYFAFLARRRLLPPGISLEAALEGLRELVGKVPYHGARVDYSAPATVLRHIARLDLRGRSASERIAIRRDRALLTVLFSTGCRIHEALRLDRRDVEDGSLAEPRVVGKGSKARVLFLSDEALTAVRVYLAARTDEEPALFVTHDTGSPPHRLGYLGAWKRLRSHAENCGVRLTPHHFRHALAMALLNNGAALSEVQEILGHSSPETTKRVYAHHATAHLRDVMNRFRPRLDDAETEP
jgi:site-specific recombinase XerD